MRKSSSEVGVADCGKKDTECCLIAQLRERLLILTMNAFALGRVSTKVTSIQHGGFQDRGRVALAAVNSIRVWHWLASEILEGAEKGSGLGQASFCGRERGTNLQSRGTGAVICCRVPPVEPMWASVAS